MDSPAQLARRIFEAQPSDLLSGMFVEASLQHLSQVLEPGKVEAARRTHLGEEPLSSLYSYPVGDVLRVVQELTGGLDADCSMLLEGMGRAAAIRFAGSSLGKTVAMLAQGDPQRVLSQTVVSFSAEPAMNLRSYAKLSARAGVSTFRRGLLGPAFGRGFLVQGLDVLARVKSAGTVIVENASGSSYTVKTEW